MPDSPGHVTSTQEILRDLSQGLLRSVGRVGLRGDTLEIHHGAAPLFDPVFLHSASEKFGVSLSLNKGRQAGPAQRVQCDTGELPFQDKVFSMVVLHHVLADGKEAELSEAVRVLARDGVLIVLGLNRQGWRHRSQGKIRRLPGLAPLKVKFELDRQEMTMQGFAGAGLLGMKSPVFMHSGPAALGLPIADVILLQARHRNSPEVTPLRFREQRSTVVQSAPMGS
ncbi:methyltransferase domain-containing protein [Pseudomonadota bacterium]